MIKSATRLEPPQGLSIPSFLWSVIRPYKWWYLLMLQAPICSSIYPLIYNYAVKLLINLFAQETHINYRQACLPVSWFIIAQLSLVPRRDIFQQWELLPTQ